MLELTPDNFCDPAHLYFVSVILFDKQALSCCYRDALPCGKVQGFKVAALDQDRFTWGGIDQVLDLIVLLAGFGWVCHLFSLYILIS